MLPLLLEEDSLAGFALLADFELLELFELFVLQDILFLLITFSNKTGFVPVQIDLRTGLSRGNITFC